MKWNISRNNFYVVFAILASCLVVTAFTESVFSAPTGVNVIFRRGTTAQWAAANTVLANGEPGYEYASNGVMVGFKIGNGVTGWNGLGYAGMPSYADYSGNRAAVQDNVIGNTFMIGSPGFSNLSTAKVTLAGAKATVYIPQDTATNTLTIPATMGIAPINGAIITIASGKTLTVNGPFSAGNYQVFAGAGTVTGLKEINPTWFYDGAGDWTSAINKSIVTARSNTLGGTVLLPAGSLNVTSINASSATADFTRTLTIKGHGKLATTIVGTAAGSIVLDGIGTNDLSLQDFTISGVGTTGLLLARSTTSTNCSRSRLRNINVDGSFTVASHVAIAAESSVYEGCRFSNTNAAANYTTFYTGNYNDSGITSTNGTLLASSNTDNRMYSCEFYAPFNNANVIVLNGVVGYSFYSPLVITGAATGGNLVTYQMHGSETVFSGPVNWHDAVFEGDNPRVHNLVGTANQINYFNNINQRGGYTNIYLTGGYDFINYNSGGTTYAIMQWSNFNEIRFNAQSIPSVTLYALDSSTMNLYTAGLNSVINITGYQGPGDFFANTINYGTNNNKHLPITFGTAIPTTGTYGLRHFQVSTVEADRQAGVLGWECIVAGTPGTWITHSVVTTGIPSYADNAAALAGGLTAGRIYRTADALKVVH